MLDAYLAFHARQRPRAVALLTPRRRLTYAELDADVNRFAGGLSGLGLSPASGVVAVEAATPYHKNVLTLALARLAVASTPASDAKADLVVSQRAGPSDGRTLRLSPDWTQATAAAPPVVVASAARDPDGLARVLLSSGLAEPRRVPLSWRRLEAQVLAAAATYPAGRLGAWVLSLGVESELGFVLAALAWSQGATAVTDWESRDLPHLLERQPPGLVALTPVQLSDLLRVLPAGFEPRPGWRLLVSGGLLAPAVAREARLRLSSDVQVVYGSPETGRVAMGPAARLDQAPGAVGWPQPGVEIAIVGPDGQPVAEGESGEIRIRSDRAARGYLDDPAATAEAFQGGFFRPGDLGRSLPDGALVVEGRLDERMDIQGVKVLPSVLEHALLEHPGIRDAAAVAVPDAKGEDECWIAVAGERQIARAELLVRLTASGARVPPVRFAWTEAIPRNAAGKVDRDALRAQLASALTASGV